MVFGRGATLAAIEQLVVTLRGLAGPGIKRTDFVAAVREKHPKGVQKDIVRAAFYAPSTAMGGDGERARRIQDFALRQRAAEDSEVPPPLTRRKKNKAQGRASGPATRSLTEPGVAAKVISSS